MRTQLLTDPNFRCQEALDWRESTKGGCGFTFCEGPRNYDQAALPLLSQLGLVS